MYTIDYTPYKLRDWVYTFFVKEFWRNVRLSEPVAGRGPSGGPVGTCLFACACKTAPSSPAAPPVPLEGGIQERISLAGIGGGNRPRNASLRMRKTCAWEGMNHYALNPHFRKKVQ